MKMNYDTVWAAGILGFLDAGYLDNLKVTRGHASSPAWQYYFETTNNSGGHARSHKVSHDSQLKNQAAPSNDEAACVDQFFPAFIPPFFRVTRKSFSGFILRDV